jgi:hypothetical protein
MFIQCPFHQDKASPIEMQPHGDDKYICPLCGFVAEFVIGA